jgi:hypothetical protein
MPEVLYMYWYLKQNACSFTQEQSSAQDNTESNAPGMLES